MDPVRKDQIKAALSIGRATIQLVFLVVVLVLTTTPLHAADQEQTVSLRSSILALDSARQTAFHELEGLSASSEEKTDYENFIVYLNTRIVSYCMELTEHGDTVAMEGLPCPETPTKSGTEKASLALEENIFYTTGTETANNQTQAEKTAGLDGDFLSALGAFDEMLLNEEEKVATRVPRQRESGTAGQNGTAGSGASGEAGGSGSADAGETGEQGTMGKSGDGTDPSTTAQTGQTGTSTSSQSQAGAGNSEIDHSAYGAPGGKLPPPEDDDIVARQLREAAEKETDPELKKKLWEEYWKYKGVHRKGA